jgi:gamma-glutamyltranspeptidase/glutathione hydrolase
VARQNRSVSRQVAVAATGPVAVHAGLAAAQAGGNAVDAAIASMVAAMGTEPGIVSALGGAFVSIWPAGGDPEVIDGNVEMPGRGQPAERFGAGLLEMNVDYGGGITLYAGHGSVATPGAFAALGLAHERHGAARWSDVLAPASAALRAGYHIGAAAASFLAITADTVFGWDEHTRPLVRRPDGSPLHAGDLVRSPDLADTLDLIGEQGHRIVYTGELAERIAADSVARGGLITAGDLAAYQAVVRTPLRLRVGDWDLATNPPPSVGGPMLAVMLGELVTRPGREWTDVIDIQRHVLSYRRHVHDLSQDLEEDGYALLEKVQRHGLPGLPTSSSTAHVSAVDSDGTACAITASSGYGAGATVPGTGLMLNNCLGEPELNRLGLHALRPGTRLASNMAPSVGRTAAGETLAIGTPGADRITTALMQVLARYCLMGIGLQDAIDRPRLHVRVLDDGGHRLEHEDDPEMTAAAEASGMSTTMHAPHSMFFGGVGAAHRSAEGELTAAADPRREAATGIG